MNRVYMPEYIDPNVRRDSGFDGKYMVDWEGVIAPLKGLAHHRYLDSWSLRLGLDLQYVYRQQAGLL